MEHNQGFPIIRTKIMIPAIRPGSIQRVALIRKIEEGIEQGCVLISAPPGYGKTTLAAEWAGQKKTPVAWITLDEQENDLLLLNRYFHALAEDFQTQDSALPVESSIENNASENFQLMLASLINECTRRDTEFTLVLDDYHVIHNKQIHEGFIFLLENFPAHFRLVIITRSDPPFPLARLRANNRILELRAPDLCFSREEAGEFFSGTAGLPLSPDDINRAYQRTEGWITGLQLEAITHREIKTPGKLASGNSRLIMEYMVEEIYFRQPPPIQAFLLKSSVLDTLNGPMCDFVLDIRNGEEKSQSLLHSLYHANLFLIPLDQQETWFRYHPLFSQALRGLLEEKQPSEIPGLYNRAVDWCDRNGHYEEALVYAGKAGDQARYLSLLEKYSLISINKGSILDTLGWINRTDRDWIATSPLLCLLYSWGLMLSFELEESSNWLEKARQQLSSGNLNEILVLFENDLWRLIHAGQSMLYALQGDIDRALDLSSQAMQLLPEESGFSHCFGLLNRGFTCSLNGDLDQAIRLFEETITDSQRSGNRITLMLARSNLAELYIDKGKLSKALALLSQSLKHLPETAGNSTGFQGYIYKEIGEIYLIRNQLDEAEKYLQLGAKMTENWLPALNELDTHIRMAHLYHCQTNYTASREEIRLARGLATSSQGQLDDLIIDITEIRMALLRGQTNQAMSWFQKNGLLGEDWLAMINRLPVAIGVPMCLLAARLFLVQGRLANDHARVSQSINMIQNLFPVLERSGLVEYQIEAYTLLALGYHELENLEEMFPALQKAFRLAEPEEIRQVFLDEGIPMSRLVTHYLAYMKQNKLEDAPPGRAFLSDLLFRFTGKEQTALSPEPAASVPMTEDPFLAEMLTPREIEVISLVAGGKSNGQIAEELHLSINTVKRHLNKIFLKLGVSTRTQAILVARRQGWIRP